MKLSEIILVDETDKEVGTMGKLEAHQKGLLHRAYSVFIFNEDGDFLLQKRALDKYHSGGLWSNTCCSHPGPGEDLEKEAGKRLLEEMGLECKLMPAFNFKYLVNFENGLIEHEYDHVFIGVTDKVPEINISEVQDWKYIKKEELSFDILAAPSDYTEWFKLCYVEAYRYFSAFKTELMKIYR